jgi:peptide/nickel transport system permease protein
MRDGRIVERSDVDALFESPAEDYTRELLSSARRVEIAEV